MVGDSNPRGCKFLILNWQMNQRVADHYPNESTYEIQKNKKSKLKTDSDDEKSGSEVFS